MQTDSNMAMTMNTVLASVAAFSLTLNGYFLKRTADRLEEVSKEVAEHDNRLVKVETVLDIKGAT